MRDSDKPFAISIYDMQGRVLRSWQEAGTRLYDKAISVTDMPAGRYTLVVTDGISRSGVNFSVIR